MLNEIKAHEGKVWAYKDQDGNEITMGKILYLGLNDNMLNYYEIDEITEEIKE